MFLFLAHHLCIKMLYRAQRYKNFMIYEPFVHEMCKKNEQKCFKQSFFWA